VDEYFVVGEGLNAGELRLAACGGFDVTALERLNTFTAFADHHAGARGENDHLCFVGCALDFDAGNAGVFQVRFDSTLDADVLVEPLCVALGVVPLACPGTDDPEPKTIWMCFLSHSILVERVVPRSRLALIQLDGDVADALFNRSRTAHGARAPSAKM